MNTLDRERQTNGLGQAHALVFHSGPAIANHPARGVVFQMHALLRNRVFQGLKCPHIGCTDGALASSMVARLGDELPRP